jgi:hypothetical protein
MNHEGHKGHEEGKFGAKRRKRTFVPLVRFVVKLL